MIEFWSSSVSLANFLSARSASTPSSVISHRRRSGRSTVMRRNPNVSLGNTLTLGSGSPPLSSALPPSTSVNSP